MLTPTIRKFDDECQRPAGTSLRPWPAPLTRRSGVPSTEGQLTKIVCAFTTAATATAPPQARTESRTTAGQRGCSSWGGALRGCQPVRVSVLTATSCLERRREEQPVCCEARGAFLVCAIDCVSVLAVTHRLHRRASEVEVRPRSRCGPPPYGRPPIDTHLTLPHRLFVITCRTGELLCIAVTARQMECAFACWRALTTQQSLNNDFTTTHPLSQCAPLHTAQAWAEAGHGRNARLVWPATYERGCLCLGMPAQGWPHLCGCRCSQLFRALAPLV
jgi:hypothetical protein